MNTLKTGIIILNYNTWEESIKCINSIIRETKQNYHIYLIDNLSTDCSVKKLRKAFYNNRNISLIESRENKGYSAGNNIGIKRAIQDGCSTIFIINSDVELLNNAIDRMNESLLGNAECMVVGPSVLDNKGQESQLARKKLTWTYFIYERHPLCYIPYFKKKSKRNYTLPDSGKFIFDGMVSGCCFGMRSKEIKEIGYLDEKVFLYYEEDILAYKMSYQNKKAIVDCDAKVWHKGNISTNKEGKIFIRFHRWISAFYLLKKYVNIKKWKQYGVFVSNIVAWGMESIVHREYRKYFRKFFYQNIDILNERQR